MDDCCNYYNNDTCVDECPAPRRPSDDNRCSKTEINILYIVTFYNAHMTVCTLKYQKSPSSISVK